MIHRGRGRPSNSRIDNRILIGAPERVAEDATNRIRVARFVALKTGVAHRPLLPTTSPDC